MTNELFSPEAGKCDSPKLAWLKKHALETEYVPDEFGGWFWACRKITPRFRLWMDHEIGSGETEDEACSYWAKANEIPMWNEESACSPS